MALEKENLAVLSCVVLSLVAVIGVFNRITFPAFLLVPGLQLLPYFVQRCGAIRFSSLLSLNAY